MTQATTRRNIVRGAAWTVPVIAVAATAPAFAASPINCTPCGYKRPGYGTDSQTGKRLKDYVIDLNCIATQDVTRVVIDGKDATKLWNNRWILRSQPDSRNKLFVQIFTADGGKWSGNVEFNPED